uniref:Uncharacterized protein n=1 Tax=Arundo donax TaxID=35708 RepID=A0A0A9E4B1_ARUDO
MMLIVKLPHPATDSKKCFRWDTTSVYTSPTHNITLNYGSFQTLLDGVQRGAVPPDTGADDDEIVVEPAATRRRAVCRRRPHRRPPRMRDPQRGAGEGLAA